MTKLKLTSLKVTEKDIRGVCRDYLRLRGWFVFHLLQGLGCFPGLSDLVAIKDGRVLFVELKRPGKNIQSDPQKKFQSEIESAGGEYILVDSLEGIIEVVG